MFFIVVLIVKSIKVIDFFYVQYSRRLFFLLICVFLIFFVSTLAETNRAPFDLAEGESELVSGFNVEYGGLKFALIFLREYARVIWISFLTSLLFFFHQDRLVFLGVQVCLFIFLFLVFRARFPRLRYDRLIRLTWKNFLPVVLLFYFVVVTGF